ncbi:hypothetical protein ACJX0J_025087 [Zea mays]
MIHHTGVLDLMMINHFRASYICGQTIYGDALLANKIHKERSGTPKYCRVALKKKITLVMFPPHIKNSLHFGKLDIRLHDATYHGDLLNSIIVILDHTFIEALINHICVFDISLLIMIKMALSYFTSIWYSGEWFWLQLADDLLYIEVNLDVQHDFLLNDNVTHQFFWDHVQFAVKMSTDCSEILALAKVIQILYLLKSIHTCFFFLLFTAKDQGKLLPLLDILRFD